MTEQQLKRHGEPFSPKIKNGAITLPRLADDVRQVINEKANVDSPTFIGEPKSPTPGDTDNSTRITTTGFVQNIISSIRNTISSLSSNSHTHDNKSVLDGITNALIVAWNNSVEHISNKDNPHEVTKSQIGLDNVVNESKQTMFTSPTFTGVPKAPTAAKGTNSTQIATTAFVKAELAPLIEKFESLAEQVFVTNWNDVESLSITTELIEQDSEIYDSAYRFVNGVAYSKWGSKIPVKPAGEEWSDIEKSSTARHCYCYIQNGIIYVEIFWDIIDEDEDETYKPVDLDRTCIII